VAALHSPSTGIVDSHGLMLALQGDLENAGGMVAFHAAVERAVLQDDGHGWCARRTVPSWRHRCW
jgi:L-2-hydroxyglutarate oxidase LhgO